MSRPHVYLLGMLLTLACSDTTAPVLPYRTPPTVQGIWRHDFDFAGNAFSMTLLTFDSTVAGYGIWAGEACCSGTVSISGTTSNGLLKLDLAFRVEGGLPRPAFSQHFEGRLVGRDTLSGMLTESGQTTPYMYRRMP